MTIDERRKYIYNMWARCDGGATVKAHINSILARLQISSRAEAIAYAIKHRIVSL